MGPSAIGASPVTIPRSGLGSLTHNITSHHPTHLHNLASTILYNLQHQHDWNSLTIHTHSKRTGQRLPRPLISGLPPRRVYVHPDEQVEILKAEHETGIHIVQQAEREWVLPTHLSEKWNLKAFAELFDAIDTQPPADEADVKDNDDQNQVGKEWRGNERQKRVLLATLHDDSTVVYYIMHDGIVKPRQN
jgi:tRNA-splicing endonuclease subunit Sen15, fungi type